MAQPTLNYVSCPDKSGGHRMAWWQWGDASGDHVVVCAHGLFRQGRDFDVLARTLVARSGGHLRVVAPDFAGRGSSDWLSDPTAYHPATYVADTLQLLAQLHSQSPVRRLDWVGTSMGGVVGLAVCATPGLPLPVPIGRLVLNDLGPTVQWAFIERLKTYAGKTGRFDSVEQAADALWAVSSTFGPHTREQWLALTQPMLRPHPEGGLTLHYDPAIAVGVHAQTPQSMAEAEAAVWQLYDNVKARTLLLRGAQSDLLSRETAQAMAQRGPRARVIEFEGVGHAPTLIADNQVEAVASFLLEQEVPDEKPPGGTG